RQEHRAAWKKKFWIPKQNPEDPSDSDVDLPKYKPSVVPVKPELDRFKESAIVTQHLMKGLDSIAYKHATEAKKPVHPESLIPDVEKERLGNVEDFDKSWVENVVKNKNFEDDGYSLFKDNIDWGDYVFPKTEKMKEGRLLGMTSREHYLNCTTWTKEEIADREHHDRILTGMYMKDSLPRFYNYELEDNVGVSVYNVVADQDAVKAAVKEKAGQLQNKNQAASCSGLTNLLKHAATAN
ncbi:unnamed protein product, partial [Amoebophrya sp. A120]